jgi:hypothetical protein
MSIPGFTAEASLYNGNVRYQATTEGGFYGGLVQPASPFSDVIYRDRPVLSLFGLSSPYLYCWELRCFEESHVGRICLWVNRCY